MKLLLTSDLHYRTDWYEFLLEEAPKYDIISVAGDLMDGFADPGPQIDFISAWAAKVAKCECSLVLCCGNHDMNSRALSNLGYSDSFGEHWMDSLSVPGKVIPGGNTALLTADSGQIIITSCRYNDDIEVTEKILQDGLELKIQHQEVPWLVLHHVPPATAFGRPDFGANNADMILEIYKPDYLHCGHVHDAPFQFGKCNDRRGNTEVLNAGYNPGNWVPCTITIETQTNNLCWNR